MVVLLVVRLLASRHDVAGTSSLQLISRLSRSRILRLSPPQPQACSSASIPCMWNQWRGSRRGRISSAPCSFLLSIMAYIRYVTPPSPSYPKGVAKPGELFLITCLFLPRPAEQADGGQPSICSADFRLVSLCKDHDLLKHFELLLLKNSRLLH